MANARAMTMWPPSASGGLDVTTAMRMQDARTDKAAESRWGESLIAVADNSCRDADGNCAVGNRFAHDGGGADDRAVPDGDAVQHLRAGPQPRASPDRYPA